MADPNGDIVRNDGTEVAQNPGATNFTDGVEATYDGDVLRIGVEDDGISAEHLDDGILPSHVAKYAGTTSAYGGGGTSNAFTVTGAAATDVASAVIRASTNAVSITKAVLTTNTLTVHFSADPGAGTTVDYVIFRAVA